MTREETEAIADAVLIKLAQSLKKCNHFVHPDKNEFAREVALRIFETVAEDDK